MTTTTNDTGPKYPHVTVPLSGHDGNAGSMIGRTKDALRRAGADASELAEFSSDAYSGDYDHVIQTIMKWVDVT